MKKIPTARVIGLVAGLACCIIFSLIDIEPSKPQVGRMLGVALLMAIWWIAEVVPLAITSLIPVVLLPFLGISSGRVVSTAYFNDVIFLFLGGFLLALAMQKWQLHKRIAIRILLLTGTKPSGVLMGFMGATAFLSMWISNTATAMMMVPILLSVVLKLSENATEKQKSNMAAGMLLGVAYSASIGGIATLVGTPPNLSFVRIFHIMFPHAPEVGFGQWLIFALPVSLLMLVFGWVYLSKFYLPASLSGSPGKKVLSDQYKSLGKMNYEERVVLVVFIALTFLWTFRTDIDLGFMVLPGWDFILAYPDMITDGTLAIALTIPLFIIPSKKTPDTYLMDWQTASELPWDIVLLFGGGFALAGGIRDSGLAQWIGEQLVWMGSLHPVVLIIIVVTMITFLTELTSNTATTEMILPILAGLSVSVNLNPLLLMVPAAIAASMAFMLPVATPPNAIIFGTRLITVKQMAKAGLVMNLIGIVVLTVLVWFWLRIVFGIEAIEMPSGWH
ncbi:MAG: SLC13 family permease [Bacteroidetes bacterium]|nr:SLC13 family permease [Bacteroidota bacterium]